SQTNSTSTKAAAETKVKQLAPSIDPVIVAQVQEQLIRLGLYNGAPDGVVSPKTETAVKAYQAANNLTVDGRPSEDVLVHILAAEVGGSPPEDRKNHPFQRSNPPHPNLLYEIRCLSRKIRVLEQRKRRKPPFAVHRWKLSG
ncbi:MAG: peptidoglycan-binding protein, partial [Alphaproteobacteria bacterium]|nr:peptidoglycan-binding protein [Alphaproteobacteria bacterium]